MKRDELNALADDLDNCVTEATRPVVIVSHENGFMMSRKPDPAIVALGLGLRTIASALRARAREIG